MSSSTSIPEPDLHTDSSFTKMSVADVDSIGAHCQMSFCHQLDFLPFRCESCRGKFCLDHRSETAHQCANAGAWARARAAQLDSSSTTPSAPRPHILTHEAQCSAPSCKILVNTPLVPGIDCVTCRRTYCLKHRMKEDHDCSKLTPLGVGQKRDSGLNDAMTKLRAWGAARKAATSTSSSTTTRTTASKAAPSRPLSTLSRIVSPFTTTKTTTTASAFAALNTLKKSAKGDAKIPTTSRVYVHVEAVAEGREGSAGAKVPRADAFYSAEWVVGRVLDAAAQTLAIRNVNNRVDKEEDRLRVFWIEGGRLLAFGEKLGSAGANVKSGDTLVLLRGVGATEA